ncbi:MAG: hypothetical protein H6711_14825 [Myxococcales bacterium]|nr:hypothetical protein [Myxococcales bacterium]
MRLRLAAALALPFALSCSDRPVPERGEGNGMSGDPCVDNSDCVEGSVCFGDVCVQEGTFRVSLSWTVRSDFDLHVQTPSGSELSYANPSADGGELDLDDCVGGECSEPHGTHVENIFFSDGALSGTYRVWVQNFDGLNAGAFTLEVAGEVQAEWSGELAAIDGAISEVFTFEF